MRLKLFDVEATPEWLKLHFKDDDEKHYELILVDEKEINDFVDRLVDMDLLNRDLDTLCFFPSDMEKPELLC